MTSCYCDRCGIEIGKDGDEGDSDIAQILTISRDGDDDIDFELCPKCIAAVVASIAETATKAARKAAKK